MGHVAYTSVIGRHSSVAEVADYLRDQCNNFLTPDTVQTLFSQDVSGSEFFDFSDEKLRDDFPHITYGQRKRIMKIVEGLSQGSYHTLTTYEAQNNTDNIVLQDLGCAILSSLEVANERPATSIQPAVYFQGENNQFFQEVQEQPALESYKIVRKRSKKEVSSTGSKRSKNEVDPQSVEPIDVLSILKSQKMGHNVIAYVRQEKRINKSNQEVMMKMLYLHVTADKKSPFKYYPDKTLKLKLAKGIIAAFPELRDEGDCPWKTWLKKVTTKFETIQSTLPKEKKMHTFLSTPKSANSSSSSAMDDTIDESNSELTHSTTDWMNNKIPNPQNKKEISLGLKMTFEDRARWMKKENPACTDILTKYKHLASYDGDMINEEFGRREILAEDLVARFTKVATFICQFFEKTKSESIVKEVYDQFEDVNLRALVALPKLLPPHLSTRTTDPKILNHIKSFKHVLDKAPSSALLQIAPEGLDPEAYVSTEYCEEENIPIYPFLLWSTSDKKSGNLYLKIDRKTIRVAAFDSSKSLENPVLKAVSVAVKAAHVFNLEYHPQLRFVFNFLEYLMCLNVTTATSVSTFVAALRELQLA